MANHCLKILLSAILVVTLVNNVFTITEDLRFLQENDKTDKKGISIVNNVTGFDENDIITIKNIVNGKETKHTDENNNSKSDDSSSDSYSSSSSSVSNSSTEQKDVNIMTKDELRRNLINHKYITLSSSENYDLFVSTIKELSDEDAKKIQALNINFSDTVSPNSEGIALGIRLPQLHYINFLNLKSENAFEFVSDIISTSKLTHLTLTRITDSDGDASLLTKLKESSASTLEDIRILNCKLTSSFFTKFKSLSTDFVKLETVAFGKVGLTDALISKTFSTEKSIKRIYLPKNEITDIGFNSLLEISKVTLKDFKTPWVIDVAYNRITLEKEEIYTNTKAISELTKSSSFSVEIYENPLSWSEEKRKSIDELSHVLFNDFDNEGEWDDL